MDLRAQVLKFGKEAIDELTLRMDELQVEWADVNAKRNAWFVIIGNGDVELSSESQPSAPPAEDKAEAITDSSDREKGELARQIINTVGEGGFKPKEITAKLVMRGITLPSGFVSNLVFRMKKRGEVVEHNSRYYLPKFDPKPRLNLPPANDHGTA